MARAKELDYDRIADFLGALSYPVRLELLHLLRFPRALSEIRLTPRRGPGDATRRAASRPAVLGHLQKLEGEDLVRSMEVEEGGRHLKRYIVNSLKLYELTEDLRSLSVIYAGKGPAGEATGTLDSPTPALAPRGPRLVLVHGLYEGKAFSLDPRTRPDRQWVIGRKRELPIALDYDPYVSLENAMVTEAAGGYVLSDIAGSKNGTMENWTRLPKGGSQALQPGDVVGVGRSLLCYAPA